MLNDSTHNAETISEMLRFRCFSNYNMSDDWNLQHERLLEKEMNKTPGSYLGAHVQEVA